MDIRRGGRAGQWAGSPARGEVHGEPGGTGRASGRSDGATDAAVPLPGVRCARSSSRGRVQAGGEAVVGAHAVQQAVEEVEVHAADQVGAAPRPGGGTGSWRGRSRLRRPPRARSRAGRGGRAPRCPRSERSGRRRPRRGPRRRACGRRPGRRRGTLDGRARAGRLDDGGGQQRAGEVVVPVGDGGGHLVTGGAVQPDGRPAPGPWRPVVRART